MRAKLLTVASATILLNCLGAAVARESVRIVPGIPAPSVSDAKPDQAAPASESPAAAPAPSAALPAPASAEPAAAAGPGARPGLFVTINRAKVIRLPERAQTVVVGNPAIADLSLQKNGIVIVTGKSYGSTNLIALDAAGNMLAESLVNVVAQTDGLVVVQRAFDRYSYSCNPVCQPSVNLGDTDAYFNDARKQADAHNQFAGSR